LSAAKTNTFYKYDAVGNLTNVVYPVSPSIVLACDPLNRLTAIVDGVGTTLYGYDGAGQVLSEDGPWANDTVQVSVLTIDTMVKNWKGRSWKINDGVRPCIMS
jgi:YD repeat-containing protein